MTDKRDEQSPTPPSEAQLVEMQAAVDVAINETFIPAIAAGPRSDVAQLRAMAMRADTLLTEVRRMRELLQVADDATQGLHDLAGAIIAHLRAENAALTDIVRVVAEADNSDHSVCYQLCSYRIVWKDDEHVVMTHTASCVVEQARARLASSATQEQQP